MAVSQLLDPGAGLGPHLRRYPVRPTPWAYDGVPGEGSIPVPLPPPACPRPCILRANFLAISPVTAAISHLSSGLLIGRVGLLFSERPVSLRSSGLHRFGTVLEIRTSRITYDFQRKEVLRLLSDRRECRISNSPSRGSNPPAPANHSSVRVSFPTKARKGLTCRLFAHWDFVSELPIPRSWEANWRRFPAWSADIPVLRRPSAET